MKLDLIKRFKLALQVLTAPTSVVNAPVGPLVTYDPVNRRLVVEGDFAIHSTGNLYLSSDQHVVVNSGNDGSDYTHQVHLNPPLEKYDAIHVNQQGSSGERTLQPTSGPQSDCSAGDHGVSASERQHQPPDSPQA